MADEIEKHNLNYLSIESRGESRRAEKNCCGIKKKFNKGYQQNFATIQWLIISIYNKFLKSPRIPLSKNARIQKAVKVMVPLVNDIQRKITFFLSTEAHQKFSLCILKRFIISDSVCPLLYLNRK